MPTPILNKKTISWALFDWANSPFTTLIITFVFSAYFSQAVVGDQVRGAELWGYTISFSGLVIALLAPLLGAIADAGGRRKPWIAFFSTLCIGGSFCLWFVLPDPSAIALAIACVMLANIGFEMSIIFNNAMLPDLVPKSAVGRISGWAWGLGYVGGLIALVLVLIGFVQNDSPWLGLDKDNAEHIRVIGPIAAGWFLLFVLPLFLFTPDQPKLTQSYATTIKEGLAQLRQTAIHLSRYRNVLLFLVARMIYADGLVTVFAFGGIYAAGVFDMALAEVILFGILLNVTAGFGAMLFGWLDDLLGSKSVIMISLLGLITAVVGAVSTADIQWFWFWGGLLGLFVGPAQSASRSMLIHITPPEKVTEFFGFYAMTGKATAFVGPALVGWITAVSDSQRVGLAAVIGFFVVGLVLMLMVKEPSRDVTLSD